MGVRPTRFESTRDLARLPWFDLTSSGELVVADPELGPTIDVHTHLALSYVRGCQLDLRRQWPETEHYLPVSSPVDLDVYANRNFTDSQLVRLRRDLAWGSLTDGGMRRTHTAPNLLREMDQMGVVASVLLSIDFPILSENTSTWSRATEGDPHFILFGSVHPYVFDIEGNLDDQVAMGARGIKVHPAVQAIHPSGKRALRLYRACGARKLPVLWHCGPVGIEPRLGRWLTQVRRYSWAIDRCPDTIFVLGHSGALQMEAALELARRHGNVYLELASQSLSNVRTILGEADIDRVLLGSDWPFYHQAMPLAKLFLATEGQDEVRRKVQFENAARLLGVAQK